MHLNSIAFENSYGNGLILINPQKISFITDIIFYHSKPLYSDDIIFAGMIIYINKVSQCRRNITLEKTLITLENSKFLNYNGDTDSLFLVMKRLDYMTATALSMYVKNDEVMVKIHNVTIVNCSCFLGSLIEISLISSTNTKIYFHNTTIFNNTQAESTGIQGIKIKQVCFGQRNQSSKTMVVFDQCIISNNTKFSHILEILLIKEVVFCGRNIFHSNIAYYNLILINQSKAYFDGYTEFLCNELLGPSLLYFDKYTSFVIRGNASLYFTANHFVNLTSPIALLSGEICREMFCTCPIQFTRHNYNYSLIFKDNKLDSGYTTVKILYGRNFKDCYWFPDPTLSSFSPGEVSKGALQCDNDDPNPTGYPYNLCLCHKILIDCLGDKLEDHVLYPGQTLELRFILVDTHKETFKVSVGVEPIENVQIIPCQVELSQMYQSVTTQCSRVSYTFLLSNENIKQCNLQLQYHLHETSPGILNVYYIHFLPCPPGFMFVSQRCHCNPVLKYITKSFNCNINNQSVLRPENSWMSYSSSNFVH